MTLPPGPSLTKGTRSLRSSAPLAMQAPFTDPSPVRSQQSAPLTRQSLRTSIPPWLLLRRVPGRYGGSLGHPVCLLVIFNNVAIFSSESPSQVLLFTHSPTSESARADRVSGVASRLDRDYFEPDIFDVVGQVSTSNEKKKFVRAKLRFSGTLYILLVARISSARDVSCVAVGCQVG